MNKDYKKYLNILVLGYLILSTLSFGAKTLSSKSIKVTFIDVEFVGYTRKLSPIRYNSLNSKPIYVKDKLIYKLHVTIKIGEFYFNQPLAIMCYLPDGKEKIIIVNEEFAVLSPNSTHEYLLEIHTKKKGWGKITVGEWNYDRERIEQFNDIEFYDNSFYLE